MEARRNVASQSAVAELAHDEVCNRQSSMRRSCMHGVNVREVAECREQEEMKLRKCEQENEEAKVRAVNMRLEWAETLATYEEGAAGEKTAIAKSVSSEYMRLTLKGWAMYQVGQSLAELYQQASSDIQREMLTTQLCSLFDYIIDIFLSGFNQVSDETNRHFMDHIQAIDVVTPYTRERSIRTIQGDTVELGLFPDSTRAGDILCSFLGGSVFYVIRQVGNGIYKFIGEAVLMGQMDKIEREGSLESFILM